MYSIEDILKANKKYEEELKKFEEIQKEIRNINNNINLDDVKLNMNYSEAKELYKLILSRSNNKDMIKNFKDILEDKKAEEYPEIKGVHYYPIIKEIDFLSEEEKIKLDILIKDASTKVSIRESLTDLDYRILDFLVNKKIIEKQYVFGCNCGSFECNEKIITEEKFNKLKQYWEKDTQGLTTEEEDKEMCYGCIYVSCWHDSDIEISCLEEFEENLRYYRYSVKVKPDLTLDNI